MISLDDVKKFFLKKESFTLTQEIPCDLITPVGAMMQIQQNFEDHYFLLESVEKGSNKSRYSVIGLMPDLIFQSKDKNSFINFDPENNPNSFKKIDDQNPLEVLRSLINQSKINNQEGFLASGGLFGYMSYDMVRLMEEIKNGNLQDNINIPDSIFIRPQILIIFDNLFDVATICAPIYFKEGLDPEFAYRKASSNIAKIIEIITSKNVALNKKDPKKFNFSSLVSKDEYCQMVEKSKEYIKDGDIFQVLPSMRISADFNLADSLAFYRSLRSINPSPFLFYFRLPQFAFMGSSPEIMVSLKNKKVTIRPLAGTRKRGKNEEEDKLIAQDLLKDEKELAEHLMLIDLGRHDVGRVCKDGTVKVTEKMVIENYSHVMHISSNVEGIIRDDLDGLDALISGFPAGTVSGAPKIRAIEIIEEIEKIKRSFYAGCVGYFAGNGDMETCITLRSALIKDDKIYLQSGAGVVHDSIPINEYEECQNKLAALIAAVNNLHKY